MSRESRIFVAGHRGLVGSALVRRLEGAGFRNLLTRGRDELDLRSQAAVDAFFETERPEYVLLAAARVGGIGANSSAPAAFIADNLLIQTHVLDAAQRFGTERLLFLGSACIYPRLAPQPMREDHLLDGPLEPTNAPYAVAKIAGVEMCRAYNRQLGTDFRTVMPTNLYGPGDNFDLESSHVLPALIRRFHDAKIRGHDTVPLWGTGTPVREFLHVDDLADACLLVLQADAVDDLVNIGSGEALEIRQLAEIVAEVVGYGGNVHWDHTCPDGTPRKELDCRRIRALGFTPKIGLRDGVASTYAWYLEHAGGRRAHAAAAAGRHG